MLIIRPKLFLHTSVYEIVSTELLIVYLAKYKSLLKLDGYYIVVYIKGNKE